MCNTIIKDSILCSGCKEKIYFLRIPLRELYSKNTKKKLYIRADRLKKAYFDRAISCFIYQDPIKTLIHLAKYKYYDYVMDFLASLMIQYLSSISFPWKDYDFITNVPSHPVRMREREYNQSAILSGNLSNFLEISLKSGIIFCKKNKPSQTTVSVSTRMKNVENNFFVKHSINNANIIVVDDVMTTGSTLSECARALKQKGARNVLALTLARA